MQLQQSYLKDPPPHSTVSYSSETPISSKGAGFGQVGSQVKTQVGTTAAGGDTGESGRRTAAEAVEEAVAEAAAAAALGPSRGIGAGAGAGAGAGGGAGARVGVGTPALPSLGSESPASSPHIVSLPSSAYSHASTAPSPGVITPLSLDRTPSSSAQSIRSEPDPLLLGPTPARTDVARYEKARKGLPSLDEEAPIGGWSSDEGGGLGLGRQAGRVAEAGARDQAREGEEAGASVGEGEAEGRIRHSGREGREEEGVGSSRAGSGVRGGWSRGSAGVGRAGESLGDKAEAAADGARVGAAGAAGAAGGGKAGGDGDMDATAGAQPMSWKSGANQGMTLQQRMRARREGAQGGGAGGRRRQWVR
ncbi:hypothetical protein CLOP_g17409 [Closterium sp. NIES-67]|nr:hypothetical protein CLOP_g17409 [Closterium sp. NIES-67]